MVLGRLHGLRLGDRAMFALSGTFSNGVGIGIPFITYAFGEQGLVPLLMIISVHSLILLTFTCFLMEIDGEGGAARPVCWRQAGRRGALDAQASGDPGDLRGPPVGRGHGAAFPASRRRPSSTASCRPWPPRRRPAA